MNGLMTAQYRIVFFVLTLDLPAIQTRESLSKISIFLERIHVIPLYPTNFSPTHIKLRIISSVQPQCRSMDKKRPFLTSNKLLLSLSSLCICSHHWSILRIADNREGCWSDQSLLQFHRSRWSLCFLSKFRSSKAPTPMSASLTVLQWNWQLPMLQRY